ncbi:arabinogalactan oligomer/maltooligosaccharide transport system substrate-binding protein [Deinobacterium chartae]|uniref:Arabinogalactan oligomer/maltooligosaccharide transport system substrate-binding protein n=1 Tax=Deinobacterium chartae TaxID=521158 RepID=A0A841HUN1_9DEIO|nr:maltose ABC transporter substrate-binding protein [Deinobacterium chartae]MBB6097057.1 arabinogalactan oligomer/maltooligosaccharide transport system substrate-binding protein [Deinobacterium chartae]
MKKVTLIIAAVSLAMGSAHAAKLTVWTQYQGNELAWLKQVAKTYEKSNKGDTVEIVSVPFGDTQQKFILGAPKGEGPDLIMTVPHDRLGELAAAGVIEPLEKYVSNKKDYSDVALDALTYRGKLFGLPVSTEAVAVVYNKKLVPTFPANWNDFLKTAQKLTDPNKGTFGFFTNLDDIYINYGVVSAYGGYVFKNNKGTLDTKDVGIANAGATKAMAFLNDLRYKYNLVPQGVNNDVAKSAFLDGQLGMWLTGPWDMESIKQTKIDYGIATLPTPPGASSKWSPFVGVQGLVMNAYSKNKVAAAKLAKLLTSSSSQVSFNKAGGRIPASKSALARLKNDPVVAGFSKSVAAGTPMPNIPQMGAVWGPWTDAIKLATQKPGADYNGILDNALKQVKANIK